MNMLDSDHNNPNHTEYQFALSLIHSFSIHYTHYISFSIFLPIHLSFSFGLSPLLTHSRSDSLSHTAWKYILLNVYI